MLKLVGNRTPICSIGVRFMKLFCNIWFVQNRAPIYENRAPIWQTLQLESGFNEAIVLRFTASEYDFCVSGNFPIKGKLFSEGGVRNFTEKI